MNRRHEEYGYLDLEDMLDDDPDPEKQGKFLMIVEWNN